MKKFMSIVAVLAIIFALAVPSFAATLSVTAGEDITGSVVDGEPGLEVEITEAEMTPAEEAALPDAVEKAAPGAAVVEVVDVELVDDEGNIVTGKYFEDHDSIKVAFTRDNAQDIAAVLYWNAEKGVWDKADFEIVNGKIVVTFNHLCTVAFVLKDVENAPDAPAGDKKPAGNKPGTSPQTGYNTALWVAAAVVLILGAGYCFVSARKKAAE